MGLYGGRDTKLTVDEILLIHNSALTDRRTADTLYASFRYTDREQKSIHILDLCYLRHPSNKPCLLSTLTRKI